MFSEGTKFSVCLLAAKTVHARPMCPREAEIAGEGGGEGGGRHAVPTEEQEVSGMGTEIPGGVLMPSLQFPDGTVRAPSLSPTPSQTSQSNLTVRAPSLSPMPSQTSQSNITVRAPSTPPPPLLIVPPQSPPPKTTTSLPSVPVTVYISSSAPSESTPTPTPAPAPAPQQSLAQSFMWSYYYLNWQWLTERLSERLSYFRTVRSSNTTNTTTTNNNNTIADINTFPSNNRNASGGLVFVNALTPAQQAFIAQKRAEILAVVGRTWEWEIDLSGGANDDAVVSSSSSSSSQIMDNPPGAPFGMGPRACPAGSLSLVRDTHPPLPTTNHSHYPPSTTHDHYSLTISSSQVITRQVLEMLLVKYDWTFFDPHQAETEQWVQGNVRFFPYVHYAHVHYPISA